MCVGSPGGYSHSKMSAAPQIPLLPLIPPDTSQSPWETEATQPLFSPPPGFQNWLRRKNAQQKALLLELRWSLAMLVPAAATATQTSFPLAGGRGLFHECCQDLQVQGTHHKYPVPSAFSLPVAGQVSLMSLRPASCPAQHRGDPPALPGAGSCPALTLPLGTGYESSKSAHAKAAKSPHHPHAPPLPCLLSIRASLPPTQMDGKGRAASLLP